MFVLQSDGSLFYFFITSVTRLANTQIALTPLGLSPGSVTELPRDSGRKGEQDQSLSIVVA